MNTASLLPDINVSIVVPCYDEEPHLKASVLKIYELLNNSKYKFEMIFVDDCSRDKTREVIYSITKEFPNSKYIFHEKNIGRGGTFMDGVGIASGKYVGFLDIDLEVSCVYLMDVFIELDKGFDVVTVRRNYALSPSPVFILRHILSVGYKMLVRNLLGIPRLDTETGFKFFNKEKLLNISKSIESRKWFFDTEVMVLACKNKYRIKEVDGLFMRRTDKVSTVKLFKDTIEYFIEMMKFRKRLRRQNLL